MAVSTSPQPLEGTPPALPPVHSWLLHVQAQVEEALDEVLHLPDEECLDPRWAGALAQVRSYALRPAKRLRPALLVAGYALARDDGQVPPGLWRFAAALELLHTFLLIHDDVADRADLRRGGPALHRMLAPGRAGEDLAVVLGDHLFARSLEVMLSSGLPGAARTSRYYLGVCRHTAAGQYLDLDLGRLPLAHVGLWRTLKVAHLKTARYGFCAPLVCGAMLAGAASPLEGRALLASLERVGRQVGRAYQLRDDLLGLFGDASLSGKPGEGDFQQGKRTYPVVAAYVRASAPERAELERLWALPAEEKDAEALARARGLVEKCGGLAACERAVALASRSGQRTLERLPEAGGMRQLLTELVGRLARRVA
ncbi:polyprenyl synthetase family protein [Aggregicoccus sp. 17bor-14]|uniref:polyprenyl synthetase family protein n=1 Tax=Myxococcaceae TaxID=31 RepID=UPI00129C2337|nr:MULTISPECIES: polyprenyl synthetase family protein [Myxococcaceae]MBF5042990.1 polyprenyl synthetase family protein [Simulacricoccus sp. 17bor-14]MRI88756.1 polyprenyl synthetase family protein [Aggregicoccus sp. 17bor-14]